MVDLPYDYVSHSQLSQYIKCGKQYYLERIAKYPTPPTWYFIGGSAVHKATERLDQEDIDTWTADRMEHLWAQAYGEEIDEAYASWPKDSQWLKFGKVSRRDPDGQGYRYWNKRGRDAVIAWGNWRYANRYKYLLHSVEEEFEVSLGPFRVKGYIDRVFQTHDHGYAVVDLKNGTKRPENALQLALYKYGWEAKHENPGAVGLGAWFMCKDAELFPQDLAPFTAPVLTGLLEGYLAGLGANVFIPHVGDDCFGCPVKPACALKSGATPDALRYDPLLQPAGSDTSA